MYIRNKLNTVRKFFNIVKIAVAISVSWKRILFQSNAVTLPRSIRLRPTFKHLVILRLSFPLCRGDKGAQNSVDIGIFITHDRNKTRTRISALPS